MSSSQHGRLNRPPTENRKPAEDTASFETALDLVHPLIIEVHPFGSNSLLAWLCVIPEISSSQVLVSPGRVQAPLATSSEPEETQSGG